MNEIVRYVKAGTLPSELREGFDPDATVRVAVREEKAERLASATPERTPADLRAALLDPKRLGRTSDELFASIDRRHARIREDPSLGEPDPVGRVRAVRDGAD